MKGEKGVTLLETIVALAILGIAGLAFLGSIGTSATAAKVDNNRVTAENLARSEIEYIKWCNYQPSAIQYPVDPLLDIPAGWSVPNPAVQPLHGSEDGIQRVTVTVRRDGSTVFSAFVYKVDR